jgi:hypothetical protein
VGSWPEAVVLWPEAVVPAAVVLWPEAVVLWPEADRRSAARPSKQRSIASMTKILPLMLVQLLRKELEQMHMQRCLLNEGAKLHT